VSYKTVNECARDQALQGRVTAACAEEGRTDNPNAAMYQVIWAVASANDVEAAYASALAAENPDPGGDETVITDGMILAHVQANLPPAP
jgi:hypothetical protein